MSNLDIVFIYSNKFTSPYLTIGSHILGDRNKRGGGRFADMKLILACNIVTCCFSAYFRVSYRTIYWRGGTLPFRGGMGTCPIEGTTLRKSFALLGITDQLAKNKLISVKMENLKPFQHCLNAISTCIL